jgi:hypothetical protein
VAASAVLPAMWLVVDQAAQRGGVFAPFLGQKFLALAIACLAPSGRLGAALLALTLATPFAQTYLTWSPEIRDRMPAFEPLQTGLVVLVAAAVLIECRRFIRRLHEATLASLQRSWLRRLTRLALWVRERSNSPLQTLRASHALLRARHADIAGVVDRMERALDRLCHLNTALAPLDRNMDWKADDLAFDGLHRIEAELREGARVEPAPISAPSPPRSGWLGRTTLTRGFEADGGREARLALLHSALLCTLGGALGAWISGFQGWVSWHWLVLAGAGAMTSALALLERRLSRRVSLGLVALLVVIALGAIWTAQAAQAAGTRQFAAFNATKILMIAIALTSASSGFGRALLVLATLTTYAQWTSWSDEIHARVPDMEPLMTLLCGLVAVVLIGKRRRHAQILRDLAWARTRQRSLQRVNRLSLLVRELANTPLQALRFGAAVIRARHADLGPIVDRMERSVAQLQQLNTVLARIDPLIDSQPDSPSSDALTLIEREVQAQLAAPVPA